jgi:hypothetical protein
VITLLVGAVFCAVSWWLLNNGIKFYGVVAGLIGAFAIIAAFLGSTEKAGCPFCGSSVSVLDRKEGRRIRCEKCSEYSVVNAGLLRALDPATISDTPEFESPAFRNGVWPKGCVACGAPAQRLDDLSATTVGGVGLLVGVLQVMRGSVKGVPYCAQHRDKLALKVHQRQALSALDVVAHDESLFGGESRSLEFFALTVSVASA